MMWMDVDAALTEVPVNLIPLLDAATAKVIDEGVTYNEAGMDLIWHFETTAGVNTATPVTPTTGGDYDWAHTDGGMYTIEIPATGGASANNDTEGFGYFTGNTTANLPFRGPTIGFRAAALNNALIDGGDVLDVNLTTVVDAAQTAGDIVALINGIGTAGGAAISTDAADDNEDGGIPGVTVGTTKVGTQTSGTYLSTSVLDGTAHVLTHDGQSVAHVYQFLTGGGTSPVGLVWTGLINPINDTLTFQLWNHGATHGGPGWETVGTLEGQTSTTAMKVQNITMYARHMGTSAAELGKGYLQVLSAESYNHILRTDQVYYTYAITSQTVGYSLGAIWVDSAGTAASENYVNGTADNPCPWANALVIAASLGIDRFHIANDNTVTLTAAFEDKTMFGEHYYLALEAQSINDSYILGATITGVSSAANHVVFVECEIGAATIPPSRLMRCGIGNASGTFTAASAGDYTFHQCYSMVPGSGTPVFDFDAVGSTTGINNRAWTGGASYLLDQYCTVSHEVLAGGGQSFTSSGADIELRGRCREVTFTFSAGAAGAVQAILHTGEVTITGTATATTTIQLDGIGLTPTDDSVNTTVTNRMINRTNWNGGDWALDTDSNGRMRIVDGTGAGELDTTSGTVEVTDGTMTTAKFAADFLTNALIADDALDTEQFADDFLDDTLIADDALVAATFATGAFTADAFAADCLIAASFASDVSIEFADALLVRDLDQVEGSAPDDSICGAALASLHWETVGNSLVVYKTDDETVFMTIPIESDPDAEGVTRAN